MRHIQRVMNLLEDLRDTTASIYYVPDIFVFDLIQARTGEVDGMPVVALCETPFYGYRGVVKRLMDLTDHYSKPGLDFGGATTSAHRLQPRRTTDRTDGSSRAGFRHGIQRQPHGSGTIARRINKQIKQLQTRVLRRPFLLLAALQA